MQDSDRVGAECDARANLAQDGGLLVDVDIKAGLAEREGGRQPADPAADDQYTQGLSSRGNAHHDPLSVAGG